MKILYAVGWGLLVLGITSFFFPALYEISKEFLYGDDIPLFVKIGLIGVFGGFVVLLIQLIIERLEDNKKEHDTNNN